MIWGLNRFRVCLGRQYKASGVAVVTCLQVKLFILVVQVIRVRARGGRAPFVDTYWQAMVLNCRVLARLR